MATNNAGDFFGNPIVPGLEHWKRSFSQGVHIARYDPELTYEQRFQMWMIQGGMNKLMTENCFVKCLIGAVGGTGLGLGFGAFLAPFDGRTGMRVISAFFWLRHADCK
jgi:hypothetical protein